MPYLNKKEKDFFFISEEDPERVASMVVHLCRERIPRYGDYDPIHDIQVVTPMRRTAAGVERLNDMLQKELNPAERHKPEVSIKGSVFRLGDKVMQIRNNYQKEVYNGDIGLITELDPEEGELVVTFRDSAMHRPVLYDFSELDELVLSYAVSVHKSQGSEYPVIIMPVITQHYLLLQRNLLYTGITRARKLAVLVGTKKALAIAVRNNKAEERYSNLDGRLRSEISGAAGS
jgi:exodeoxyribonuclease V alpha subunit